MNPTLALIMSKNSADIEAIVEKIGVSTLLSLTPHIFAIMQTLSTANAETAEPAKSTGL